MPRRSDVVIAYPGDFATQAAWDDPIAQGDIDTAFPLNENDPRLEPILRKEDIASCDGQGWIDRIMLSRYQRLTIPINADPAVLFGCYGWNMGVVVGDTVTLLPRGENQPPPTTLVYGHVGSAIDPILLTNCVLHRIRLAASRTGYDVELEFRCNGAPEPLTGYTLPECPDVVSPRLKDGAFSVNSTDYKLDTISYEFTTDNRPDDDDPFTIDGPDRTRDERADLRRYDLAWEVLGETGDALDLASQSDPVTVYPFSFRVGDLSNGLTIASAGAFFEANGGEGYNGGFKRSMLPFLLTPKVIAGEVSLSVTRET